METSNNKDQGPWCKDKLLEAWKTVKNRVLECLEFFEHDTSVTIKLVMQDHLQLAFVKTDDDGAPVLLWNYLDDENEWKVGELWLEPETTEALVEFLSMPNASLTRSGG